MKCIEHPCYRSISKTRSFSVHSFLADLAGLETKYINVGFTPLTISAGSSRACHQLTRRLPGL